MTLKELEIYYDFECELSDGSTETLRIPRVSTRMKYRLGIAIQKMGKEVKEEELSEILIEMLCPGLMERYGDKSPSIPALGLLVAKIIDIDGDSIFGKDWKKKLPQNLKKAVKQTKKREKKGT